MEKVKEIYKLGLKHGMKLSAISGVNGVFSDEDIARVVKLAKEARKHWKGGIAQKPAARKGKSASTGETSEQLADEELTADTKPRKSASRKPSNGKDDSADSIQHTAAQEETSPVSLTAATQASPSAEVKTAD